MEQEGNPMFAQRGDEANEAFANLYTCFISKIGVKLVPFSLGQSQLFHKSDKGQHSTEIFSLDHSGKSVLNHAPDSLN